MNGTTNFGISIATTYVYTMWYVSSQYSYKDVQSGTYMYVINIVKTDGAPCDAGLKKCCVSSF